MAEHLEHALNRLTGTRSACVDALYLLLYRVMLSKIALPLHRQQYK